MLFSKKHPDAHGVLRYRESQRKLVFLSAVIFAVLCILTVAFAASPDTQQFFRSCSLCRFVNCVEPTFITGSPWWDCDLRPRDDLRWLRVHAAPRVGRRDALLLHGHAQLRRPQRRQCV